MSADHTWVIGLTGGIGTGKTRVADRLRELGAAVECADRIVHELQRKGGRALPAIVDRFGQHFITAEGELDRERLGELVFRDPDARQRLNQIIHPLVLEELQARLRSHVEAGASVVVIDIPLLIEGRVSGRGAAAALPFDQIVLVYAPRETQIERVMQRDGLSREAVEARLSAQLDIERKRKLADVIIDNTSDWGQTDSQLQALFARWTSAPPPDPTSTS